MAKGYGEAFEDMLEDVGDQPEPLGYVEAFEKMLGDIERDPKPEPVATVGFLIRIPKAHHIILKIRARKQKTYMTTIVNGLIADYIANPR